MEWLVLCLFVPLIVVPVVLMVGYAGCTPFGVAPDVIGELQNLKGDADDGEVTLTWDEFTNALQYRILRTAAGITPVETLIRDPLYLDANPPNLKMTTYKVDALGTGRTLLATATITLQSPPHAPDNIRVSASGGQAVLTWDNIAPSEARTVGVQRHDRTSGAASGDLLIAPRGSGARGTFTDPDSASASKYSYRIAARVPRIIGIALDSRLEPFTPLAATGQTFRVAFQSPPGAAQLQPDWESDCFIQRIPKEFLQAEGTEVRITLRLAIPGEPLTLDAVFISQQAPQGDPFDSHTDIKACERLPLTVASAGPPTTITAAYNLKRDRDLLVTFGISSDAGAGNVPFIEAAGFTTFYKTASADEAPLQDRTDFATIGAFLYLIEKIEVR
jgi:hypothetical protein